jgi:hypothetical protein
MYYNIAYMPYLYFKLKQSDLHYYNVKGCTWSYLSITETAFRSVLASLRAFTPFLRVVHTFGAKTNDKQLKD